MIINSRITATDIEKQEGDDGERRSGIGVPGPDSPHDRGQDGGTVLGSTWRGPLLHHQPLHLHVGVVLRVSQSVSL